MALLLCYDTVPRFPCFQQQGPSPGKDWKDWIYCPKCVGFPVWALTVPKCCPDFSLTAGTALPLLVAPKGSFPRLEEAGILLFILERDEPRLCNRFVLSKAGGKKEKKCHPLGTSSGEGPGCWDSLTREWHHF